MKSTLITLLSTILTFSVCGNDGVYLNRGGVIYPTNESRISLDKEILSFTVRDRIAQVDIQFEFFNPEKEERTLLVGFQAPTTHGDVSDKMSNENQISNFRILKDGILLPYQLKAAREADGDLKEPSEIHFSQRETGLFVYLFEVTFKPGTNKLNHSYSFPASKNVAFDQIYNYILTTGAKWANGAIKDLTIQMDMGPNQYFFVHDIFGPKANWSVIGTGKVTNKKFYHFDTDSCTMVRVLSGKLQIDIKEFQPRKNIEFGTINDHSFINRTTDLVKILSGEIAEPGQLTLDKVYSKNELRLLKNSVYAQHGYTFRGKDLQAYFAQFEWYLPDPNLTMDQINLTKKEQLFIDKITGIEKK
jgi:hypothetical protein